MPLLMSFLLIDDPQFYGLEMSLSNIFMIGLFRSNNTMAIFSKIEKNFISHQTRTEPYIYDVHIVEGWREVSKICHMSVDYFINRRSIVCFCGWRGWERGHKIGQCL